MRKYQWLLAFIVLAIIARWGSFFISVINHDESTYIVIADEILRGEVYLRDLIDTKPIGIFWIYAALIKLTGGSIPALRIAASCVVGVGGFGLFLAGNRATGSNRVGIAAGLIYLFVCSLFTYYGVSPNTEIFFNVFTIFAVALAVAPRIMYGAEDPAWHWPVAGFLLGLAVIIKPFAAAEALAIGLFMVWYYGRQKAWGKIFTSGAMLVGAFTLPLLFVYLYYQQLGLLDQLAFYTLEVSSAYPIELPWYLRLKYMGDYLLRFSPFVILGGGALVQAWRWRSREAPQAGLPPLLDSEKLKWGLYLLLQFALVTVVVLLTGKRFGHYQVQLHPVVALLAAIWWAPGTTVFPWLRKQWLRKYSSVIVLTVTVLLGTAHYFAYVKKRDEPPKIAAYFQDKLGPDENLFIINGFQIAYHLLDKPVPTPYIHSSLLFYDHHVRAFQIDEVAEADRILNDASVKYLVRRREDANAETPLTGRLLPAFELVDEIGDRLLVYRRK
jgi:4-amino-4-deoxy-L-arabinose transferase-like glycosyltransferase